MSPTVTASSPRNEQARISRSASGVNGKGFVRGHGDERAENEAVVYIKDFLYAERQIQLIKEGHPYHTPDARYAAELEVLYGIRYSPENADFEWDALKRLEGELERKANLVADLEKQISDLKAELQTENERLHKKLSSIIRIAEGGELK